MVFANLANKIALGIKIDVSVIQAFSRLAEFVEHVTLELNTMVMTVFVTWDILEIEIFVHHAIQAVANVMDPKQTNVFPAPMLHSFFKKAIAPKTLPAHLDTSLTVENAQNV